MYTGRSYGRLLAGLCLAGAVGSGTLQAAVSPEKAEELGGEKYTCLGAERAGNESGTIPEYSGKFQGSWPGMKGDGPAGYKPGPYADEEPRFTINASNMDEYADKLTPGQKALMKEYPDEFYMKVYPTHRDFKNRDWVCDVAKKNAVESEITDDGLGVTGTTGAPPFPMPQSGLEAIWNVINPHRAWTEQTVYDIANVYDNGSVAWGRAEFKTLNPSNHPDPDERGSYTDKINAYFYQKFLLPARDAGFTAVGYQPNNFSDDATNSWQYQPGLRRVRQAPEVGFDYPVPPAGMRNVDDDYLFNGSPERFTWKLVGKREYYVPYHNFKINDPALSYEEDLIGERTVNPEHVRYELHRVWVIEGTLKDGVRHNYGKRVVYVDEDSWLALWADNYDKRGNLWRPNYVAYFYSPESWAFHRGVSVYHDLTAGTFEAGYLVNEAGEDNWWKINRELEPSQFSPEALSRRGR
ncbi:DUF1329 domain-containing protein [Algiphilus aromaticivorans]|uniref:DUF1329 domain-containing protein n=1 Tax=Algiphilus aromaticivorans TaxID=382454 RepID=UPI000693442E|nr:DUF1329 domain-containing protein [Algiphilus aromaticivorans]